MNDGIAFDLLAHFVERDAENLYTTYSMTNVRVGALRSSINWPGPIKVLTKRYFTDNVLVDAHNAFITVHNLLYESEVVCADRRLLRIFTLRSLRTTLQSTNLSVVCSL